MQKLQIALLGPQVTHWTWETLLDLQSVFRQSTKLDFLAETIVQSPAVCLALEQHCGIASFSKEDRFKKCNIFMLGNSVPDPQSLSNTDLATLTIVS